MFRVKVEVFSLEHPEHREEVEMVVDTGAFRTLLPRSVVEALGVRPDRRQTFRMVNGEPIERDLGWVGVTLMGNTGHTHVILGEPGDHAVLGALTLEELELEVDPSRGTLRPMQEFLLLALAGEVRA